MNPISINPSKRESWKVCDFYNFFLLGNVKEYEDDEDEEIPESRPIPQIKAIQLEMRLTNQVLFCHPATQSVFQSLIRQLQEWQNIVLRLPRIQGGYNLLFNSNK